MRLGRLLPAVSMTANSVSGGADELFVELRAENGADDNEISRT